MVLAAERRLWAGSPGTTSTGEACQGLGASKWRTVFWHLGSHQPQRPVPRRETHGLHFFHQLLIVARHCCRGPVGCMGSETFDGPLQADALQLRRDAAAGGPCDAALPAGASPTWGTSICQPAAGWQPLKSVLVFFEKQVCFRNIGLNLDKPLWRNTTMPIHNYPASDGIEIGNNFDPATDMGDTFVCWELGLQPAI